MASKPTKKVIDEETYRWLKVRVISRNDYTANVTYTLDIPGYSVPALKGVD